MRIIKLIGILIFTCLIVSCGSSASVTTSSLNSSDLNFCSFIENTNNFYAFGDTGTWNRSFKDFYSKKGFNPQNSALKYIDDQIMNFEYSSIEPDLSFQTFVSSIQGWQERCRQIQIDPNN